MLGHERRAGNARCVQGPRLGFEEHDPDAGPRHHRPPPRGPRAWPTTAWASAEMAGPAETAPTVAVRLELCPDRARPPSPRSWLTWRPAAATLRTLSTVRRWRDDSAGPMVEVEVEVEGLSESRVTGHPRRSTVDPRLPHRRRRWTRCSVSGSSSSAVGRRSRQAVLGAVSEADRHNLRGEKISVDTIPLVGEENLAAGRPGGGRPGPGSSACCSPARSWAATSPRPCRSFKPWASGQFSHQHGRQRGRRRGPRRHRSGTGPHDGGHGHRRHGKFDFAAPEGPRY